MLIDRSYKIWMSIAVHRRRIYELRVFRRETLVWIKFLKRFSTELSRPTIPNSNACNCTSSHGTLLFWIGLVIRDHLLALQAAICFDKSSTADLRAKTAIPLAVVNKLTNHASSWEADLLTAFFR